MMKRYNVREMVERRLEGLEDHAFMARDGSTRRLRPKGMIFARIMQLSSWIYQSKSQSDRR
jgi:hypothetical protein